MTVTGAFPDAGSVQQRRAAMRTLAHADVEAIKAALTAIGPAPSHAVLREPEIGLVMLRGRIGGDGAPFNIGEATVTRAAVRLESGEVGLSYVLGRAPEKARAAALIDAIWQTAAGRKLVEARILTPLRAAQAEKSAEGRARTAATKVDFFTMIRGEDE